MSVTVDTHEPTTGRFVSYYSVELWKGIEPKLNPTSTVILEMLDEWITTETFLTMVSGVFGLLVGGGGHSVSEVSCLPRVTIPTPTTLSFTTCEIASFDSYIITASALTEVSAMLPSQFFDDGQPSESSSTFIMMTTSRSYFTLETSAGTNSAQAEMIASCLGDCFLRAGTAALPPQML
jgi:hypothetical protein